MAYMDFKDLQDQVLARGYGEVDRARVKAWINEAAQDLNLERRWEFNAYTHALNTVAGTATASMSSFSPALQYFGRIYPANASAPALLYADFNNPSEMAPFRSFYDDLGSPIYVTLMDDVTLRFAPVPDKVYNFTVFGYKRHVQLSADGDVPAMPESSRMYLVYRALQKAAERDRDVTMAQYWAAESEMAFNKLLRFDHAIKQEMSGYVAALPESYSGRYDRLWPRA